MTFSMHIKRPAGDYSAGFAMLVRATLTLKKPIFPAGLQKACS